MELLLGVLELLFATAIFFVQLAYGLLRVVLLLAAGIKLPPWKELTGKKDGTGGFGSFLEELTGSGGNEQAHLAMHRATVARLEARAESAARDEREARLSEPLARFAAQCRDALEAIERGEARAGFGDPRTGLLHEAAAMLPYLDEMLAQRRGTPLELLGDADRVAEACYRPIIDFTVAQNVPHATSTPVSVIGRWDLSIITTLRRAPIAVLRLPPSFRTSLLAWPAIAHEVARDTFNSVDGLEASLRARLGLPTQMPLPWSIASARPELLHPLYGAWLEEIFADVFGVSMMGPAYVESMTRIFANPGQPDQARAAYANGGQLGPHPPPSLRVALGCRVLDYLGLFQEADAYRERWQAMHGPDHVAYIPLQSGNWAAVPHQALFEVGAAIVDMLTGESWPALSGFRLIDIPGLAYQHGEHAAVKRFMPQLAAGKGVRGDARLVIAAGVLATAQAADGAASQRILRAVRLSIDGVGAHDPMADDAYATRHADLGSAVGKATPTAVAEALILGAALAPRPRRLGARR